MSIWKKWKFWLPAIYCLVGLFNLFGFDDKNLLLFFTSPPFWITEQHWFVVTFTHPSNIPLIVVFLISLIVWFLIGKLIDWSIEKIKKEREKEVKNERF